MITNHTDYNNNKENTEYIINPSTEHYIYIDSNRRIIDINNQLEQFVTVAGDNNAETIYFAIDRYFDNVDLFKKQCMIKYKNKYGEISYIEPSDYYVEEVDGVEKFVLGWTLTYEITATPRTVDFQIAFFSYKEDGWTFDYMLNTIPNVLTVQTGLV